jgi:hypothetical protein
MIDYLQWQKAVGKKDRNHLKIIVTKMLVAIIFLCGFFQQSFYKLFHRIDSFAPHQT